MRFGITRLWTIVVSTLLVAACSSGSTTPSEGGSAVSSVLQDLSLDPTGQTTVLTLPTAPGTLTPGHFEADGGQLADSVVVAGSQATVTWDGRVSPSDRVRVVGVAGILDDYVAVTTSDSTVPSFTVGAGTQTPGLGGDSFTIQFSGPRLVEAEVEELVRWSIRQDGLEQDLTGSTFDYDPATGEVDVDLGPGANLHATFEVRAVGIHSVADVVVSGSPVTGAATGDAVAPTLVSAEQNLTADEYGRTVDFTFDEAMDPTSSAFLSNFTAPLPVFAVSVQQPSETVLRVTFTEPMIPTVDSVTLANLEDAHGNDLTGATVPVAQGSTVANGYASTPELRTVEDSLNDLVAVVFTQALDPEDAVDPAHWSLVVDSTPVDLSAAVFDYDLVTKALTITIGQDFANGADFDLGPASGSAPLDVDGEEFVATYSGTVTGDGVAPEVVQVIQNRILAADGTVLDVSFDEDVDQTSAETTGNWSVTGGVSVLTATRMADLRTVRLELDGAAVPGDVTLGVAGVEDIAGNAMPTTVGLALLSNDTVAPSAVTTIAQAVEGAANDVLRVTFDDDMVEAEVEDATGWAFEAPLGTALDVSAGVVDYDPATREARMTVVGAVNLPTHEGFSLLLSGMRDLGGNVVSPVAVTGTVTGDVTFPVIEAAWVDGVDNTVVHLRTSEPCSELDDAFDPTTNPLGLTTYHLRDDLGASLGYPTAVSVASDALGVSLTFGSAVVPGSDTLDVRGILDLAGNQLFPVRDLQILAEDAVAPDLQVGVSTLLAVEGEENDVVTVVFDRDMSSWAITDHTNYDLRLGGDVVDLSRAYVTFDGARTVTIDLSRLGAGSLQTSNVYDLTVTGLRSVQGVPVSGSSSEAVVVTGDGDVPTLDAGKVRMDAADPTASVLIEMSEAIDGDDAADETAIDIGAVNPDLSVPVGRRTTRATFAGGASVGQTVNVSLRDLAGNLGLASQLIVGQDVAGPVATTVAGVVSEGAGGDTVRVTFDKPVQTGLALNPSRYTVSQAGTPVDLGGTIARYESGTNTVVLQLQEGVDLQDGVDVDVTVDGITDLAGLAMTPANLSGATAGDAAAPTLVDAFVNYRADFLGRTVDLRFSEDVAEADATLVINWGSTGGQALLDVTPLSGAAYRLTFAGALQPGDQLTVDDVDDLAGNPGGALVVDVSL